MHLAHDLLEHSPETWPDGVHLVELALVSEPDMVARSVAGALGISEQRDVPLRETLCRSLGARRMLLLIDNCEHLVSACAGLAHVLLRACPHVRMLATSREPLAIPGEVVVRVPPLEVPRIGELATLRDSEAVQLFALRARPSSRTSS